MAHPYSSTPMYGATTSYTPQQPYYPPFPPNGLQQQIHTPPGLPQQPPQPPGSYQQSPSTNGPRFDANAQIRPPAASFPHFPPPPAAFNPDLFKQFASAGLPPPPPPSFPPVPLPTTGYPQFSSAVSNSAPSPYAPHNATGNNAHGFGYGPIEQVQQHLSDPFGGGSDGHGESRDSRDFRRGKQSYGAQNVAQHGSSYPGRHTKTTDSDLDKDLPSFGSKSDLDLLFASVRGQAEETSTKSDIGNAASTTQYRTNDGNVSPYDPSRPATVQDRASGSFGTSATFSRTTISKPIVRTYENKSPSELRQLAKGALLSLAPHNIHFKDLVNEGVDPQVLRGLYGELGIKVAAEEPTSAPEVHEPPSPSETVEVRATQQAGTDTFMQDVGAPNPPVEFQAPPPQSFPGAGSSGSTQNAGPPLPAAPVVKDVQSVLSPNLERKDRIAQLLAAKTGRPSPATPSTDPPASEDSPIPTTVTKPAQSANTSLSSNLPTGTEHAQNLSKARAQTEIVRQRMEQLKRETQAKAEAITVAGTAAATSIASASHTAAAAQASSQPGVALVGTAKAGPSPKSTFMIPGLFMTSSGNLALEETPQGQAVARVGDDTEMAGSSNENIAQGAVASREPHSSPLSSVPLKRSLNLDADESTSEPQAKKVDIGDRSQLPAASEDAGNDDQSEGEIVEEFEDDRMDTRAEAVSQSAVEGDDSSGGNPTPGGSTAQKPETSLPSLTALQQDSGDAGGESGSGQLYRAKQSEIEAMRRKIAELEQRTKVKRTKSQMESSIASNPASPALAAEGRQLSSPTALQPSAGAGTSTSLTTGQRPVAGPRPIAKLTPAQLAERAAALKADLLRQRAQRQQVLQEGLPDLHAEVQNTEDRLDRARAELARAQTEAEQHRTALDRLTKRVKELSEEIAEIEKQLHEGRSGQKQFSDELQQIKLEKLAESQEARKTPVKAAEPVIQSRPITITPSSPQLGTKVSSNANDDSTPTSNLPSQPTSSDATFEASGTVRQAIDVDIGGVSDVLSPNTPSELPLEPAAPSQDGMENENPFQATTRVDTLQTDAMEISPEPEYVPEIHRTPPPAPDSRRSSKDTSMDMDDENDSDGSVSMSDSGSEVELDGEDYEPADVDTSQPMQQSDEDSDEYDPEEAPVQDRTPTTGVDEEDVDEYEPSVHLHETEAGPSEDVADESADEGEVVSTVSPEGKVDDAESGLQLTEADSVTKTQEAPDADAAEANPDSDGNPPSAIRYVPYKTPLSGFKTYRFHPAYNDTVKTGYRSLTYSNQIDPSRPLCPTELSGELCRDPKCEEQHFSQLGLSDDKILIQMSSAADIKDKAVRDQFIAGLKQVIATLKARDVKEFEEVANALSTYRRNFFAEKDDAS